MKAWRIKAEGELVLEKLEPTAPKKSFVKVKIMYSALSDMDGLLYSGEVLPPQYPITIGRQAVGMVTEVGEGVTNVTRGDRVVIDPYVFCDSCVICNEKEKYTDCLCLKEYGTDEDGFLSDFVIVRCEDLFKLPDRVSDEDAMFASHIATAMNIASKLSLEKGKRIAIMGGTIIGLVLAQIVLYYQAVPILVDSRTDRLEIAESLGIYYCINSTVQDVQKKIFSLTGGSLADSVVHFTASQLSLEQSLSVASFGTKVILAGWSGAKNALYTNMSDIVTKQLKLVGLNNGAKLIPSAINMIANKSVNVSSFITKIIPFSDVETIIKEQMEFPQKEIKVLVKM
ncbi:MAG: alcohol dehydrogenase catalytic domain-containing protein [Firmicutes bacterium]|nr:alcohol dehydrogenase catalytic domain-containing protein [Bacillota bacterium]